MSRKNWEEEPDARIIRNGDGDIIALGDMLHKLTGIPKGFKPGEVAQKPNGMLLYISYEDFEAAPDTEEEAEAQAFVVGDDEPPEATPGQSTPFRLAE
jgi:hypothetical protein